MRIEKVVLNSSPLIVLLRSQQVELLPQMFASIMVPQQDFTGQTDAGIIGSPVKSCL